PEAGLFGAEGCFSTLSPSGWLLSPVFRSGLIRFSARRSPRFQPEGGSAAPFLLQRWLPLVDQMCLFAWIASACRLPRTHRHRKAMVVSRRQEAGWARWVSRLLVVQVGCVGVQTQPLLPVIAAHRAQPIGGMVYQGAAFETQRAGATIGFPDTALRCFQAME